MVDPLGFLDHLGCESGEDRLLPPRLPVPCGFHLTLSLCPRYRHPRIEIAAARRLADEGRHRAAGTLAATFLSELLRSAAGDDTAEPAALAGVLLRDGRLDGELYARLVDADPIARRALDGEGDVSAADTDTLIACLGASATALG